jgi:type IV pilus assembly protein PilY1
MRRGMNLKQAALGLLFVSLVLGDLGVALADDSEIFGANIQPNVLILLDSSGSMDDEIGTFIPYDPNNTTYPAVYTRTTVYQYSRGSYSVYATSIADVSSSSARNALSTVGYWTGRIGGNRVSLYVGNYLNYYFCDACDGREKKIDIAKRVLTNLVNSTEGVRFGLMVFQGNSVRGIGGGRIVAPIGSSTASLVTAINGVIPQGYTPLGEMVRDAGLYYQGRLGYPSPIQYQCQTNFIILISDGLQNGLLDVRDVTGELYTEDQSTDYPGVQNIITDTIGFAVDASERAAANDVLQTAATNGGGAFYSTDSGAQLEDALQRAIRQILAATFTFATPAIPTTSTTGNTKVYVAAFQSDPVRPFWQGYLKAYQRDSTTGQVPVDANGVPLDSALVWEAGLALSQQSAGSRTIYTAVGGSRQAFTRGNGAITQALLGASSGAERDQIIDFIRGEGRSWKLGDIFHSSPVLVAPLVMPSADATYAAFLQANRSTRTPVVLVGANDGMLHAFRESDGAELWAFIPTDLLGSLKNLTAQAAPHGYYVDASPIAADVCFSTLTDGTGNCTSASNWKTIVVFGERRGGRSYTALDITDTTNPLYLWSFTDSRMGETWSEPAIVKVKMSDGSAKWVAFVGGGYDTAQNNNSGKAFFAIDLATGAKLWEYYNAAGSTDDHRYMNFSLAGNPTAVDLDFDGFSDRVYIGDVGGQLWKFDVSAAATLSGGLVTNWTGKRLFAADPSQANPPATGEYYPAQAIYAPPALAFDDAKNLWVYFGTGDRNHPNNTGTNRFYALKDTTGMTNGSALTESSLANVTSTNTSPTGGWFITLGSTEKVWSAADIFNKIVFFTSFTPSGDACGAGGDARLYEIQMTSGYAALDWTTGLPLTSSDSSRPRAQVIGAGIPSKPITQVTESGGAVTSTSITATTSQQLTSNPAPPPTTMRRTIYWTERY